MHADAPACALDAFSGGADPARVYVRRSATGYTSHLGGMLVAVDPVILLRGNDIVAHRPGVSTSMRVRPQKTRRKARWRFPSVVDLISTSLAPTRCSLKQRTAKVTRPFR